MSQTYAYAGPVFKPDFGIFHDVSDDSYRRGYVDGKTAGERAGYEAGQQAGYADGQLSGYGEGHQAGYEAGHQAGQLSGMEQGIQAEYDRFWDAYQQNGERTNYSHGFTGSGWTDETFKPKYPLRIVGSAESMCVNSAFTEIPVAVDFSQCDNIYYAFTFNSNLVRLPRMDISKVRSSTYAFRQCSSLEEIECLVFSENTVLQSNTFYYTSNLKHLTAEGTVNTELNFAQSSMLTNESVQSILDHLKDLTGATARTLTFHAIVGAALTDAQKAAITAKNWTLVY